MTPTNAAARKALPLCTGVLDYFPDALLAVAELSRIGNEQHNPGQPLHWAKEKSTDEADALLRHLADRGTLDTDGVRHSVKVAWRALALLQREIDAERAADPPGTVRVPAHPVRGVMREDIPARPLIVATVPRTETHVFERAIPRYERYDGQLDDADCRICGRPHGNAPDHPFTIAMDGTEV